MLSPHVCHHVSQAVTNFKDGSYCQNRMECNFQKCVFVGEWGIEKGEQDGGGGCSQKFVGFVKLKNQMLDLC